VKKESQIVITDHGVQNPFYIKHKIEMGAMADIVANEFLKKVVMVVLMVFIYGAMCLKYIGGA